MILPQGEAKHHYLRKYTLENTVHKIRQKYKGLKERDYRGKKFIYGVSTCNRGCSFIISALDGAGKKDEADGAATSAMRDVFDTIPMKGTVVIGEGEMDEAPMLYIGEKLGTGYGPRVDVAVDPLEGTNIVAAGGWNALAVIAIADHGNLLHAPDMYMDKIAVGPEAVGAVDIDAPIIDNLRAVAKAKNKDIEDVVATVLNRPRHQEIIEEIRKAGARIKLINDGDVAGAINTAFDRTGVDILFGSGGAPEGVLAAVALKCLGGEIHGKLLPQNEAELARCKKWA